MKLWGRIQPSGFRVSFDRPGDYTPVPGKGNQGNLTAPAFLALQWLSYAFASLVW